MFATPAGVCASPVARWGRGVGGGGWGGAGGVSVPRPPRRLHAPRRTNEVARQKHRDDKTGPFSIVASPP